MYIEGLRTIFFLVIENWGRKENKARVITLYHGTSTFLYWRVVNMTRLKPPRIILTLRKVARYGKFILYGKESLLLMHKSFILLFVLVSTTFYSLLFSFLHLLVPFCSLLFLLLLNEKKMSSVPQYGYY